MQTITIKTKVYGEAYTHTFNADAFGVVDQYAKATNAHKRAAKNGDTDVELVELDNATLMREGAHRCAGRNAR
jgi:hypothetical protein